MKSQRKCGILLHLTSLPSPYGIGDLGKSAYDFVSFLKAGNQKLWQILPLGPTSFGDSPYQSFSAFAGNFYLISPDVLLEKGLLNSQDLSAVPIFDPKKINYGDVIEYKTSLLKKAFANFLPTEEYNSFCSENKFWLDDYCLFSALKDFYIEKRKFELESPEFIAFCKETKAFLSEKTQKDFYYGGVWVTWSKDLSTRTPLALKNAAEQLDEKINFYKFLQFEFFKQWQAVKAYANLNNVEIIGDIPIFVAFDSADTWANQSLFNLDENGYPVSVAGVPPDYFSETGQLWGNPLYNWSEHKKTDYNWWINRIKTLLKSADIIRIDHFRGFESYFSIPFGSKDATKGSWEKSCRKSLFDSIKKEIGYLPIIAEDLGIITPQVTKLRESCKLPGMKVLQFAFDNSENNDYLPHNYEKNCVVYTGTHDNDTTLGWYNSAPETEKDLFRRYMCTNGVDAGWDLIRLAIASTATMAVYPMQDVLCLGSECRMNTPGTSVGNWQWRYTEDMLLATHAENLCSLTKIFKR